MPVPVQNPEIAHVANGFTTVFAYPFLIFDAADLRVRVDGTLAVLNVDYTVTGVNVEAGGTVVFGSAPSNGANVTIQRRMPLGRDIEYQYSGDFQSPTVNRDFDRLWMMGQDIDADGARAMRLPVGDTASTELPQLSDRALRGMAWDADGNAVAAPASDATSLGVMLADKVTDDNGAALVGFGVGLAYPGATVGAKLSERLSVKDFGAVGDGVADDTAAIQATVTAAGNRPGGCTVFFPNGTYKVSAPINVTKPGVMLKGDGKDSTQVVRATAYGTMFYFANGATVLDGTGIGHMRLIDNGANNNSGNLIEVENASRFTADNLTFFGGTNGIILRGAANVELSNIYMYMQTPAAPFANRYGIRLIATGVVGAPVVFGSNVSLNNVHIYGGDNMAASYSNLEACLEIEAVDGLWVNGCYFGGASRADVWLTRINPAHSCGNIYFANTMLDICRGHGLLIDGTVIHQRMRFGGSISCAGVGVAGKEGIYVAGPVDNFTINATVDGWKGNGIHLGATGGMVCTNVNVTGSLITANTGYGVQIEANAGTNQFIVTANNLTGNTAGSLNDLTAGGTSKLTTGNLV